MAVKLVFNPNLSPLFEADPVLAKQFMELSLIDGAISGNTSTGFSLTSNYPEGSLTANLTGSGFTYATIDGTLQLTGGTIDTMDLSFSIVELGTFDAFSVTNIDTDFADIASAILADRTGEDNTAIEDYFLSLDWEYTLNDSAADADRSYVLGDGEVEFNMAGDDVVYALGGHDDLFLGDGKDIAYGGAGNDTLDGGAGRDLLKGGTGKDKLIGGNGNDRLYGQGGDDVMSGGNGNDRIFNSAGSDLFIGGNGDDRFIFRKQSDLIDSGDTDTIKGFQQGKDVIDLSGIDANVNNGLNAGFLFIGDADFSNSARRLRVEDQGTTHLIQGDVDGDGEADFEITVTNFSGTFAIDDFIL